jgi:hypothetical protein
VTQATETAQIHQTLDVHGLFATQITFYGELANLAPDSFELLFAKFANFYRFGDARRCTNLLRPCAANPKDIGQGDHGVFMIWYVYTSNTSHSEVLHLNKIAALTAISGTSQTVSRPKTVPRAVLCRQKGAQE